MRAAVVEEFGSPAHVEERPLPQPGPGQILVRLETCGLCHTDIHAMHGDWPVKPSLPLVPGHEGVGIVGGFLGAVIAPTIGVRIGAGRAILLGRCLVVAPWALLAFAPIGPDISVTLLMTLVSVAQFLYGLSMGIEDANDIAYRQAVAPDAIQGRMNATIRTINRVVFFFGALSTGALATWFGYSFSLGLASAIFVVAALIVAFSPLRTARHEDIAPTRM